MTGLPVAEVEVQTALATGVSEFRHDVQWMGSLIMGQATTLEQAKRKRRLVRERRLRQQLGSCGVSRSAWQRSLDTFAPLALEAGVSRSLSLAMKSSEESSPTCKIRVATSRNSR